MTASDAETDAALRGRPARLEAENVTLPLTDIEVSTRPGG
jgi:hypothetical protein